MWGWHRMLPVLESPYDQYLNSKGMSPKGFLRSAAIYHQAKETNFFIKVQSPDMQTVRGGRNFLPVGPNGGTCHYAGLFIATITISKAPLCTWYARSNLADTKINFSPHFDI
ncbi:unnamed protein product [Pieris brassicae]|uniref:Uncharacterized protein n=1 Tax=Pieris brassicae TaxID=7116 RepID=A0A9P0TQV4_PIEBR|nr:unnamed protein product [Pieris brassicae]